MSLRKEIILSISVLIGIILISYAYAKNDINFWKYHDTGWIIIVISCIIIAKTYPIFTMFLWLLFAGLFNSWVTSMFFDVTKYEANQILISWGIASVLFVVGAGHTVWDYYNKRKIKRQQLMCKKDARSKYRDMVKRINTIEEKLDEKSEAMRNIFDKLLID